MWLLETLPNCFVCTPGYRLNRYVRIYAAIGQDASFMGGVMATIFCVDGLAIFWSEGIATVRVRCSIGAGRARAPISEQAIRRSPVAFLSVFVAGDVSDPSALARIR